LGIKTIIVSGYQGGSEIDVAVERNEVVCWSPLVATYFGREPYKRWHKSGFTRVVVQSGSKRDERIKEVPTLNELMQQYNTPEAGKRSQRRFSPRQRSVGRFRRRRACLPKRRKHFAMRTAKRCAIPSWSAKQPNEVGTWRH
jgi:hypothetical protein